MNFKSLLFVFICGLILQLSRGKAQDGSLRSELADVNISVRLSVQNKVCATSSPPYTATYLIPSIPDGSTLFDVMEMAESYGFTFDHTTHPTFGAYITTVNGLVADDSLHQYWGLLDGWTGAFLPLGASSYKPKHGDNIVFQLALY